MSPPLPPGEVASGADVSFRGNLGFLLCLAGTFQRGRDLPRVKSRPPASQNRTILRHQKIDVGRYPRIPGGDVSLTKCGGAVFSLLPGSSVKFKEGSDIGDRGGGGIYQ